MINPAPASATVERDGRSEAGVLLDVRNVSLRFGGIVALDNVSFHVDAGERVAVIGPNGAGKTSMFNVISRTYLEQEGTLAFDGVDLKVRPTHRIASLGIGRTFQNIALFPSLTVRENVALGRLAIEQPRWIPAMLGFPSERHRQHDALERADGALARLEISEYADGPPVGLPYGVMRQIELARALVGEPRLLLLDEPAAGLSSQEIERISSVVRTVNEEDGIALLVIEHRMDFVMALAQRIVVLDFGRVIASGPPELIQRDKKVIEAYLGVPDDDF
jgi:branched-chain amino acid transport system ATP-binding protein